MDKLSAMYHQACDDYNNKDFSSCAKNLIQIYIESNILDITLCCYCAYKLAEINVNDKSVDICIKMLERQKNLEEKHLQLLECIKSRKKNFDTQIQIDNKKLRNTIIINSYYDESSSGIGDFLRGCCYLHTILSNRGLNFEIDFKNHQIGHFIKSKCKHRYKNIFDTEKNLKEQANVFNYFENMKKNLDASLSLSGKTCGLFKKKIPIFSNYSDFIFKDTQGKLNYTIQNKTKRFMRSNIIFDKTIEDKFKDIGIKKYDVVHFRLGDYQILKDNNIKTEANYKDNINTIKFNIDYYKCLSLIIQSIINTRDYVILLSDSNSLKDYAYKNIPRKYASKLIVLHYDSFHCSSNPGFLGNIINKLDKKKKMLYVALDMKICTKAQKIVSYSVYPWGSGFTFWLSKIYDIPIINGNLIDE